MILDTSSDQLQDFFYRITKISSLPNLEANARADYK